MSVSEPPPISAATRSAAKVGGVDPLPGRFGVQVFQANAVLTGENTISGNVGSGVFVGGAGNVDIGNPFFDLPTGNTIKENGAKAPANFPDGGVFAFRGGSLLIRGGAKINDNTGNGVTVGLRSSARIFDATINNNTANGILLRQGGGLLLGTPAVTVTGNSQFGLQCVGTEASFEGDTSGITGNGVDGTQNVSLPACTGF